MVKVHLSLRVMGEFFEPPSDEEIGAGLEVLVRVVRGTIGTSGRYKGLPTPYGTIEVGAGALTLEAFAEMLSGLPWLRRETIETKVLELHLAHDGQCNWELSVAELAALAKANVCVALTAYQELAEHPP